MEADDGITMRTAPCQFAPAVTKAGQDVTIPQNASFDYLDRNSRQSSDCNSYGFNNTNLNFEPDFCWVLGTYNGVTGWLPVQRVESQPIWFTSQSYWTSALCTFYPDNNNPTLLVSDDGSATGCAEMTPDPNENPRQPTCFPADAAVMLPGGASLPMSKLQLGDEVAVRKADGSLAWEAVYAFGHRDADSQAQFVEVAVETGTASRLAIQVGVHQPVVMLCSCQ